MALHKTPVYTIGAFIEPVQIKGKWIWAVTQFEDDCYLNGVDINLNEEADTEAGLFPDTPDDNF